MEGDWQTTLAEVNRKGRGPSKMVVAHLHPGEVSTSFQQSLTDTITSDLGSARRMLRPDGKLGLISTQQGAGRLERGRNDTASMFLDEYPDADLLLFADSDMGWDATAAESLARTMDETGHPIIGGLCFGSKPVGMTGQRAMDTEWFPTLYRWAEQGFDTGFAYPQGVVEVGATGAAFLMIHRTALEKMRARDGDRWFDLVTRDDITYGEDMSFCLRAVDCGLKIHVDTSVKTSHKKEVWITESLYRDMRRPAASAVTVVIPVKDRLDLTRGVLGDLNTQGGWTDILIFDNGSTDPEMVEWLQNQSVADVFSAPEASIHEMWNAGIDEAISRHGGLADVVLLNNDLKLGTRFCQRLIGGMRETSALAVSANYDGRKTEGVAPLRGICAGRYDGTGGLAGFAFALRAEWIASGYRFPTDMAWYYGDNDLCLEIEKAGGWYGIVSDARVEHVQGGSQTFGNTPGPTWDADRAAFEAKWPDVKLVAA